MGRGPCRAHGQLHRHPGVNMAHLDYLPVGLAILAVLARIAMFLPRRSGDAQRPE